MFYIVRMIQRKTLHNALMAGGLTGLAIATKYGGIFLSIPMLLTLFISNMPSVSPPQEKNLAWIRSTLFAAGGFMPDIPCLKGWEMFAASLAGVLIIFKRNWRHTGILYLFPLLFYIIAGKGYNVILRYMIPILPFLCIAIAEGKKLS